MDSRRDGVLDAVDPDPQKQRGNNRTGVGEPAAPNNESKNGLMASMARMIKHSAITARPVMRANKTGASGFFRLGVKVRHPGIGKGE